MQGQARWAMDGLDGLDRRLVAAKAPALRGAAAVLGLGEPARPDPAAMFAHSAGLQRRIFGVGIMHACDCDPYSPPKRIPSNGEPMLGGSSASTVPVITVADYSSF